MKNRRNYYRLLQVQPDAPAEIIRAAYRAIMLKLKRHPDLGGSTVDAADLNEAYEVLTDPRRRAAYDKELYLHYTKKNAAPDKSPLITVFCPVCKRPLARKPAPGDRCSSCRSPRQSESPDDHRQAYERALTRTRRNDKVLYYTTWPGTPQQGRMIDFSPMGMRFCCAEKVPPGTVLKIKCELCDASGTVTNARTELVEGRSLFAIGVCFIAVNFVEPRGAFVSTSV